MELQPRKLYDVTAPNKSTRIIMGESSNVLNWDNVRFKWAYPMYKVMLGNHWTPFEIDMTGDKRDWISKMSEEELFTFKRIIGLLAMMDSIQTDYAGHASDFITDSSVSSLMVILAKEEVVHNQSYSYVLSSLVSEQEQLEIFDYWKHDPVLRKRNDFIAEGYVDFVDNPTPETFLKSIVYDVLLEGLFFYASFAFFYDLARHGKMTASSQMINYINRDEQVHVRLFTNIFKAILEDFPELDTEETRQFVYDTFKRGVELEIEWGNYIIGNKFDSIDSTDLAEYVQFTANTRLAQMGYKEKLYPDATNTMRWIKYYEDVNASKQDFFEGKSRQYGKVTDDNGLDDLD